MSQYHIQPWPTSESQLGCLCPLKGNMFSKKFPLSGMGKVANYFFLNHSDLGVKRVLLLIVKNLALTPFFYCFLNPSIPLQLISL